MRRLIVLAGAVALAAASAVPVTAQQTGSCFVDPDPVAQFTEYTVYASGLQPTVEYVLHLTQPGQSTEQHKWDGIITADASGNAQQTIGWGGPRGIWDVGPVDVAIAKSSGRGYNTKGGKVASCGFDVVAG
jgi:hypothetical protein